MRGTDSSLGMTEMSIDRVLTTGRAAVQRGTVTEFHAHIYHGGPDNEAWAHELRAYLASRYPAVTLGTLHKGPVAFHPEAMFQVAFPVDLLETLVRDLETRRASFSVLVHPVTGDVVQEHFDDASWLGQPMALDRKLVERYA